MAEKRPVLSPERARAVITTRWGGSGYRPLTIGSIESYQIETNMDQDADNFTLVVGDPHARMGSLLNRDNEIRCQIFGIGLDAQYLLTGIADDVEQGEDGRIILTGRDRSCIATDSIADAGMWREVRAADFVARQAAALGVTSKFNLRGGGTKKTVRTDGSETVWEFWYRLLRNEQQWLWMTADGTLTADTLNSGGSPDYYFGTPPLSASDQQSKMWIPVEASGFRKTTQTRVGRVVMFYNTGNRTYHVVAEDGTIKDWDKKPVKYIEKKSIHTREGATKEAWEEIFESKVGALEVKIAIPDLGMVIRQNRIARLRIPELDLNDDWFVVGSVITANENGFMQEVRLREKNYAITRRVPEEPPKDREPGDPDDITECLNLEDLIPRAQWMQFFVNAAHHWRSAISFDLYLAVLLAICDVETGFRNVTSGGTVEWFKWDGQARNGISSLAEWKQTFANENPVRAVGPMQLYDKPFKVRADNWEGGRVDEHYGNRWLPEANIWEGAHTLQGKGATREEKLWDAVRAYNGSGPDAEAYMKKVQNLVYNTYLPGVQDALTACKEGGPLDPSVPENGIIVPTHHGTDHCTCGLETFYAWDFMDNLMTPVFMAEPVQQDPSGRAPHLIDWKSGYGGWTFQLLGESGTRYWITHLDENDPKRYTGGKLPANGYIGKLTDSTFKAGLIGGAHVHVGSPQWPYPGKSARGCHGDC